MRILVVRASRALGSGYVQGMADIAASFLAVFLDERLQLYHPQALTEAVALTVATTNENEVANGDDPFSASTSTSHRATTPHALGRSRSAPAHVTRTTSTSATVTQPCSFPTLMAYSAAPTLCLSRLDPALVDALLSDEDIATAEADAYGCLTQILNRVQDFYVHGQPGIQRGMRALRMVLESQAHDLVGHLDEMGVDLLQFGFRWYNCLYVREIAFDLVPRLLDLFVAESGHSANGLPVQLTLMGGGLLTTWQEELVGMDFAGLITFLQNPPSLRWGRKELDAVLARTFLLQHALRERGVHLDKVV
jgi:hypothetical protein